MKLQLTELVTEEDIVQRDMRIVMEACGLDIALLLFQKLPGVNICIPHNALREFKERYIREHKNDYSAKQLGVMLDMSERQVYSIINRSRTSVTEASQDTLFQ